MSLFEEPEDMQVMQQQKKVLVDKLDMFKEAKRRLVWRRKLTNRVTKM